MLSKGNAAERSSVLIVGAGPNGLCAAAFLCSLGVEVHIQGTTMESWVEKMPRGMILRSTKVSSSIASPSDQFSMAQYEEKTGERIDHQPSLAQFVRYAQWFQQNAVGGVDSTRVRSIQPRADGFAALLADGRTLLTKSVVVAPGIHPFPYAPPLFSSLPARLASHISSYQNFDEFIGKEVAIIGKGQSALESAALMHESGVKVEILTRGPYLRFIQPGKRRMLLEKFPFYNKLLDFLYPPTDLAGPPDNWAIADPQIYRSLPKASQDELFSLIGPIGSHDLEARLADVPVTTGVEVKAASERGGKAHLDLSDGTSREVDHVLLATGFRPNLNQLDFLSDDLKAAIDQEDGYPNLTLGYESTSVKGLYFLGALACKSQGPIHRFVCGTYPVSQYLTEAITGSRVGYPEEHTARLVAGRRRLYPLLRNNPIHW